MGERERMDEEMKNFTGIAVGDVLKITGQGAPGFAELGEEVQVIELLRHPGVRVCLMRDKSITASFVLSCGAERLEKVVSCEGGE